MLLFFLKKHFTNVIQNNHEFLELTFDEIKPILASGKSIFYSFKSLTTELLEIKSYKSRGRNECLSLLFFFSFC
jgi:hypothetical protein